MSVDNVSDLRERILESVREIEELSRLPLETESFFRQFLRRTVTALGAHSGTAWLLNDAGELTQCSKVAQRQSAASTAESDTQLRSLLAAVIAGGESRYLSDEHDDNPFASAVCLAPLFAGDRCVGAVQYLVASDTNPQTRQGRLQFIEQMTGFASHFLTSRTARRAESAVNEDGFWKKLADFTLALQSSLEFKTVAYRAVNDGRLLLECDRVSLARIRGRKTIIEAISGQDRVNQRANQVRAMQRLAAETIPAGETIIFAGQSGELPPHVEQPLAEFIAESGTRMLMLIPLRSVSSKSQRQQEEQPTRVRLQSERPWGAVICEWRAKTDSVAETEKQAHVFSDHVAAALLNARDHERIFLRSSLEMLGRCREWFVGRKLLKTIGIVAVVAGVIAALMLIPWEYRVEGEGRLMPVLQREVFAPWDGVVVEIAVKDGKRVTAGDLLLKIRNDELESQLTDVRNRIREDEQERHSLEARFADATDNSRSEDAIRLQGKLVEIKIRLRGLREQEELLAKRIADLDVRATSDGVVATFQIEQILLNRPVTRGEMLLQVMDDRSDWVLELDIDEPHMGHVLDARKRVEKGALPIVFVLATEVESTFRGHLTRVSSRPMLLPERGSVMRVFGAIDDDRIKPRIGAEVRAKIHCGKKSLGYVLFGDAIDFLYQRLWL